MGGQQIHHQEFARSQFRRQLTGFQAGGDRMIGPERIGSSAGLVSAVAEQPSILFQIDEIGRLAASLPHPPVSVIVFGSFARREAGPDSDIDIVVVRPADVDEDDDGWADSLEAWRSDVRRLTGNPVEVVEVGVDEAAGKLAGNSELWADIRRDGRVVHGLPPAMLPRRRSA